jgi:hypothetical protein
MVKAFFIVLVLAWLVGAVWFFMGPAKAANKYVESLSASITRRDDMVLFQQLYKNKGPRNVVLAWLLTTIFTPSISYIYSRQWVRCLLSFFTLQGFGIWWIVSIFSMPFEVMNINKRLADQAYAELRLARPEMLPGSGSIAAPSPHGLNPAVLEHSGPCASCGTELATTARFCATCGAARV